MKNIILIGLTLVIISCNEVKVNYISDVIELDMNLSKEITFEEWVTNIECFHLEETGTYFNSKIIECDSFFYVLFQNNFCVSVYKKTGEHVRTIKNNIPGMMPNDIFINENEKQLWIIEQFDHINKYSLNGDFIEQQKLPFKTAMMTAVGTGHYLFFDGGFDNNTPFFLRIVTDDFTTISEFVTKHNTFNLMPNYTFTDNSEEIFIHITKNDTIYVCNKKNFNITPKWHLNFSGNFLTYRDEPEGGFSDVKYEEIINENKKYRDIQGFHYSNNLVFMKLIGKDFSFRAIDISNNYIYHFNTLIDNINITPQGNTTEGLLVVMTTQDFITHYSKPNNSIKYESIKKMFSKLYKHDNGLIVIKINLKENLP